MSRFLLGIEPMNLKSPFCIVHQRSPLSIIYCTARHLGNGIEDDINARHVKEYKYKNICGKTEYWTLSITNYIDVKTGIRLLNRTWSWLHNYLELEKKNMLEGIIIKSDFSPN